MIKASELIRDKLIKNGGSAIVQSVRGNSYRVSVAVNALCFSTPPLSQQDYEFAVFDTVVDLLIEQGGRAPKGNGRNYRLGQGDCTADTVVGAIGYRYAKKQDGQSVFDPVFVLAAILDWAGVCHNRRGYLELTAEFLAARERYNREEADK